MGRRFDSGVFIQKRKPFPATAESAVILDPYGNRGTCELARRSGVREAVEQLGGLAAFERNETCGVGRGITSSCRKQLGVTTTVGTSWTSRETIIRREVVICGSSLNPNQSSVAQWQSARLLSGWLLVRIQFGEQLCGRGSDPYSAWAPAGVIRDAAGWCCSVIS